jgi:hypothetical protein
MCSWLGGGVIGLATVVSCRRAGISRVLPAGLLAHDQARVHPLRLAAALARRAGSVATGVAMTDLEVAGGG